MIGFVFQYIWDLAIAIVNLVIQYVLDPIYSYFLSLIPGIDAQSVILFFEEYLLKGILFAREVFLNVTGLPRWFFYALVNFFAIKFVLFIYMISVKHIFNAYAFIRGAHGAQKFFGGVSK